MKSKQSSGTLGSPKGSNPHGDRVPIVPILGRGTGYYATSRLGVGFGETPRSFSTSSFSNQRSPLRTRLTTERAAAYGCSKDLTIPKKLADLNIRSQRDPDGIIDRNLYSLLYDESLIMLAYNKLKSNPGNMTPGINPTTLDGISSEWMFETIKSLKTEEFKFTPGRRIQIPKASGGERPLTIAPPRDKIIQECIRTILEAIFEPTFSDNSHGFRSGRGCHSALKHVKTQFDSST